MAERQGPSPSAWLWSHLNIQSPSTNRYRCQIAQAPAPGLKKGSKALGSGSMKLEWKMHASPNTKKKELLPPLIPRPYPTTILHEMQPQFNHNHMPIQTNSTSNERPSTPGISPNTYNVNIPTIATKTANNDP